MTSALPNSLPVLLIFQLELITRHKSHVVTLVREHEICNPLPLQTPVPPYSDIVLSLALFELLVIISLKFDEWLKDLSVLLRVSVSEKDWLLCALNLYHLQILDVCSRSFLPHVLQSIDLLWLNFPTSLLLLIVWWSDKPWK